MIRDLRVMVGTHRRTFTLPNKKSRIRQIVVNRETKKDMHRQSLGMILPHYAAMQPKLPLRHYQRRAAI